MATPERSGTPARPQPQIIVVTTAMLVFISFWRAAAIVLCDMASTVYYIGGIVEQAIGKAAPWYIGAVMLFAYAVRGRSEEHTSELQSLTNLVCRLLLEK